MARWRSRSMSSLSQREERRSVSASTTAMLLSPPITPSKVRPSCSLSKGSDDDASSSCPCGPTFQLASMCGASASQRASSSTATQPSKADTTSSRSRQPIQRDKGSVPPKLRSISPESRAPGSVLAW